MKPIACASWLVIGLLWDVLSWDGGMVCAQQPFPPTAATPTSDTAPNVPTFVTRQTTFAIPFSVDRQIRTAVEVHLYVSRDAGRTWRIYARQVPSAQRFSFTATGDGDYWFASRTIVANSAPDGQAPLRAEMQIIVDTIDPEFDFTVRPGEDGAVIATWQLSDPHLDSNSLKIEYRSNTTDPWLPVTVIPSAADAGSDHLRGHVSWVPKTHAPTATVRAEASDRAGNRTVINRRVLLPALVQQRRASEPPVQSRLAPPGSYAGPGRHDRNAIPWPSTSDADFNSIDASARPSNSIAETGSSRRTVLLDHAPPGAASSPRQSFAPPATSLSQTGTSDTRSAALPPSTSFEADMAATDNHFQSAARSKERALVSVVEIGKQQARNQVPAETVASADQSRNASAFQQPAPLADTEGPIISPVSSDRGGLLSAAGQLPPGERPQMTNSMRFQLDYDVDAVGPSGVAEVQLWATEDGGQTWKLWGTDDDRQSPFDVEVEREGILGFRVVIVGRNGLVGPKPRSGDPADIWVGVDRTRPIARFVSATYGDGTRAGHLVIRWNAEDTNLARHPVTLLFGEAVDGPWIIIASALPNDGEYSWAADPQLPPQVYLRLEVRDQAGNIGSDQTDQAIRIDGLAPKARIRGLMRSQPMDREAFQQPQRR